MKKFSVLLLTAAMLLMTMTSCSKNLADEDLSKYMTLGTYKGIEVSQAATDKYVDEQLESLVSSKATTNEVTDRAAKEGDTVSINYSGSIDGQLFEGGTGTTDALVLGSGSMIDGFEDAIIGMNLGETKEAPVTFPEEYKNNPDLQGKEAIFTITLNGIKEKVSPELTDAFIAENTNYETIEAYREATAETYVKNTVWTAVVANATVNEYPYDYVKEYYDQQITTMNNSLAQYNHTIASYLKAMNQSQEAFYANLAEQAKRAIKQNMTIYMIADAEGLTVSDEAYNELVAELAETNSMTEKEVVKAVGKESINLQILSEQVLDLIVEAHVTVD